MRKMRAGLGSGGHLELVGFGDSPGLLEKIVPEGAERAVVVSVLDACE